MAGRRLYAHSEMDHAALFDLVDASAGEFLMTYNDAREIRQLAAQHRFDAALVPMGNTHHAPEKELLIGRDLEWLRREGPCP